MHIQCFQSWSTVINNKNEILLFHQPVLRSSQASFVRSCLFPKHHWSLIILSCTFLNVFCCSWSTSMYTVNKPISTVIWIYGFNVWTKRCPDTAKQRTVNRVRLVLGAVLVIIRWSMTDELKMCHVTRQLLIWSWTTWQSIQKLGNHCQPLLRRPFSMFPQVKL